MVEDQTASLPTVDGSKDTAILVNTDEEQPQPQPPPAPAPILPEDNLVEKENTGAGTGQPFEAPPKAEQPAQVEVENKTTTMQEEPMALPVVDGSKDTAIMESFTEEEQPKPPPPPFQYKKKQPENDEDKLVEKDCELNEVMEEDEEALLTEDAYSLLYTSAFCSRTSLFAWFSITLQGGMLLVTFLDLFDTSKEGSDTNGSSNRLQIPAGSTVQVMIAQFLGMLLTAMVMAAEGDFVIGITQLIKGYDPRIREQSPNATWLRWLMTGLLQSFFGILLLFDSFILSMQSSTVIDLSLNLTALHFIQEIDNMSFTLGAESGLLGRKVTADCVHVQNLKGYSTPATRKRKLMRRRFLIGLMTVGLLVPYFMIITWQSNGHYMCTNLYIQFGDQYTPNIAYYTGFFRSQGNKLADRKGQRNYYVDDTRTYKVAYCNAENYWTISKLEENPCEFIFRSAETQTFDIIEAADENWVVNTESTGVIDVDWLKIVCNDCSEDTCSPEHGVCSKEKDRCECHEGQYGLKRFGLNCQFEEQCYLFALDQTTRDGLSAISGTSSFLDRKYVSLYWTEAPQDTPMFYDRPIFVPVKQENSDEKAEQVDSFIIFTGRRWVLYAIPDENLARVVEIEGMPSNWSMPDFNQYFYDLSLVETDVEAMQILTAGLINYFPIFFSSPLNYGENSFGFEPSAVTWLRATSPYNYTNPLMPADPDEGQPVSARFLCSGCTNDGMCRNNGKCRKFDEEAEGYCVCETFYSGHQCERVKDCVVAGGCLAGTCDEETGTCECDEGSYGSLCQLGVGALEVPDPFLCTECALWNHGSCDSIFDQECICDEGYTGVYCNVTLDGEAVEIEDHSQYATNVTILNRTQYDANSTTEV